MVTEQDETSRLDKVDCGILHELQLDARRTTHEEISNQVGVSPSTIRNRITQLEEVGIIETYIPKVNYERAGFQLRVQFICTSPPENRSQCARDALDVNGVISVQETITSEQNLIIEVVAIETEDLAEITQQLSELDLLIHSSEIITQTYTKPFSYFKRCAPQIESHQVTPPTADDE